jgi:putative thioredoxin
MQIQAVYQPGGEIRMNTSDFIIDVSEADFEYEVLAFSQNTPVVVDFWATWCKPCKVLGPMLEAMVREANGALRLARVDVDQNPNLALRYNVRSIPTVKAFSGGQAVGEFVGMLPEERLREFLDKITPPSLQQLQLEKASGMLALHQWSQAEKIYRDLLDGAADIPSSLLGLSKALLMQSKHGEALQILRDFPASRLYNSAELLRPFAEDAAAFNHAGLADDTELDAAYRTAIRLASRGNLPAALDGLLDILRQDKNYRRGRARLVVLSMLELLGEDDPQTRPYRSELASVLF